LDRTRDQAHGRIEHRTLMVVAIHRVEFPHAAQILQVTRKRIVGSRTPAAGVGGGRP
jgi:hypothetical protein